MLELKNITKSFGNAHVLNGISLTLDKGQIMSILGPSGGGKTTLLNIILGITDANGGQILFDGEDLTRVPMEKRGFNIVFQDYALFPNLNAYENITYGLRNNPGVSSEQEIREMISLLGLEEHLTKSIDELSVDDSSSSSQNLKEILWGFFSTLTQLASFLIATVMEIHDGHSLLYIRNEWIVFDGKGGYFLKPICNRILFCSDE